MKNFKINYEKGVIELTKTFAKEASNYHSEAYKLLTEVKKDFPTYLVAVKTATQPKNKSKKDNLKGLTCDFMKSYIEKNTTDESMMEEFNALRYGNPDKLQKPAPYGTIRKWFLGNFPEVKEFATQYTTPENTPKKAA